MEASVLIDSSVKRSTAFTERSYQRQCSGSFLHDSYTSSIDFPAYIPWQTLSSDLSDRLRYLSTFRPVCTKSFRPGLSLKPGLKP
jgi:hypothetical protein